MAARRTHVPKFGNWDANDHMPYTVVFDNARQGRGKPINPNDPTENPNIYSTGRGGGVGAGNAPGLGRRQFNPSDPEDSSPATAHPLPQAQERPPQEERLSQDRFSQQGRPSQDRQPERPSLDKQPERPSQDRQPERPMVQQPGTGREGSGVARQQPHQVAAVAERRRVPSAQVNLPSRGPSADLTKRTSRENNGFDRTIESPTASFSSDQSPSHPTGGRFDGSARAATRLGGNSPAWDPSRRKSTGEDAGQMFAPATPNRSRLRNGTNSGNNNSKDELAGKGTPALPKFGDWNAEDPCSGEGFTVIFNNARKEKKTGGPVNISRTPDKDNGDMYPTESANYGRSHSKKSWWCCFSPNTQA